MQTRALGPDAAPVTVPGFGGMPLSIDGRPSEAQAIAVLHAVLDAGATFIDTADVYCLDDDDLGHNERLIAKGLATWPGDRSDVIVGTKGGLGRPRGAWTRDARPAHLTAACDRSLRALGTDRIDLYQLHAPDSAVPFADSIGALADLQRAGKIRWIGLSNVSIAEIDAARALVTVVSVQNRLNPFFRESVSNGVVAHCARHGIGFIAYSPVGGGRLNRKLPAHPALVAIAAAHGVSPHAVAIAWVMAQGASVIPIPGARTVAHARDALRAGDVELTAAEIAAIDGAVFSRA